MSLLSPGHGFCVIFFSGAWRVPVPSLRPDSDLPFFPSKYLFGFGGLTCGCTTEQRLLSTVDGIQGLYPTDHIKSHGWRDKESTQCPRNATKQTHLVRSWAGGGGVVEGRGSHHDSLRLLQPQPEGNPPITCSFVLSFFLTFLSF